ncbi:MAG: hypothetical protein GX496_06685 [Firmicutes bacterium]|nr:hypothetical protein [Bacillota bacterium]
MHARDRLWGLLSHRVVPAHACWFCSGPEHFAAIVAPLATAALGADRSVRVMGPSDFVEALRADRRLPPARRLAIEAIDGGLHASRAEELLDGVPAGTLVVNATAWDEARGRPSGAELERLDHLETLLGRLVTSGLVVGLCVYALSAVCRWQAAVLAERHHAHVLAAGRLLPFSEALGKPIESLPPALAD